MADGSPINQAEMHKKPLHQIRFTYRRMHIYTMSDGPQSMAHRCLENCYTKLGSSTRYSTIHIYAWQMDPPSELSIHVLTTAAPNKFHI